LEETKLQEKYT